MTVAAAVNAFEHARGQASLELEDGQVTWSDRADRLDLAFTLEPDAPSGPTLQAARVLAVATSDALGSLMPPQLPLTLTLPGELLLDGAMLGQVQAALAPVAEPKAIPAWLVLGLCIELGPVPHEPGLVPDRTTLADAGAPEITAGELAEAVGRHFLAWVRRWQEEGFAPVRAAWNARCAEGSLP